jgi:hypothetical protein
MLSHFILYMHLSFAFRSFLVLNIYYVTQQPQVVGFIDETECVQCEMQV